MHIRVKLFASLAAMVPGATAGVPMDVELPFGSDLRDLASRLHLPEREQKLVFVNGRAESLDRALQEDDEVGIFPPVGGG